MLLNSDNKSIESFSIGKISQENDKKLRIYSNQEKHKITGEKTDFGLEKSLEQSMD